ncbi:hypothetical protein D6D13_00517 [Aureobasidium pullulans]|uniref:Uncharacterized protein n=1 Tax=Aureobasidium pullulans TaxID=5580 RepID=A0A4S9DDK7_AURPU|nr:hypothetical protein D6D13_00517 [Aureobasidium pullulans]
MAPRKQTVSQNSPPTKRQLRSKKSTSGNRPHLRFLDLSPELRNNICNNIIEDSSLILLRIDLNFSPLSRQQNHPL